MRTMPLGMPRFRGNSDVSRTVVFSGDVKAGCAVSKTVVNGSQMKVVPFDGSNFFGFAVHDLCNIRKVTSAIRKGESVCLRVKKDVTLTLDDGVAVDNVTGELVPAGTAASTIINADIEELGAIGLDSNLGQVENCALINLYGGAAIVPAGALSVESQSIQSVDIDDAFEPTPTGSKTKTK